MHKFAGLDGHTSSCTLGVVNPKGKHLSCQVVETNGEALVNAITGIPGKLHLCIEEGTQSCWLAEILSPHVEELVVVGLGQRRGKGQKNDKRDAFALADMLRNNDLESVVYKQVGPYSTLRQLVKVHAQIVRDVVRVKNRLHSLYRARGVRSDRTIYMLDRRESWLEQVPRSSRAAAGHLYESTTRCYRSELRRRRTSSRRRTDTLSPSCWRPVRASGRSGSPRWWPRWSRPSAFASGSSSGPTAVRAS
jgi:hypothetical protein